MAKANEVVQRANKDSYSDSLDLMMEVNKLIRRDRVLKAFRTPTGNIPRWKCRRTAPSQAKREAAARKSDLNWLKINLMVPTTSGPKVHQGDKTAGIQR